jgi:hypothetical protein
MRNWPNSKHAWLLGWVRRLPAGTAHQVSYGEHFTCLPASFTNVIYGVAAARGYKATLAVFKDKRIVVFAFYRAKDLSRPNLAAYPIVKTLRGEE